jgi:pimeloyl-ACP methyl ester carboxylesterase
MDIILVPGLWLDGSSWDGVVPALEKAGHRPHAVTLPGMESRDADRSAVTLRDQINAVVALVDGTGEMVLVGHSAGGPIAHATADARPDRVARIVYVGGEPRGNGETLGDFPVETGEVPLPDWSFFDDEMTADLDEAQRAAFRARAIPSPALVTTDRLELSDDRRYDVPITLICCEYTSADLREWTEKGYDGTHELAKIRDVEYVDLTCGHWPQLTRPEELARAIITAVEPAD